MANTESFLIQEPHCLSSVEFCQSPVSSMDNGRRLRLALIAGLVGERGAEKQLVYMARALDDMGVEVQIYSLKKEVGFYGPLLRARGLEPNWVGKRQSPLLRLAAITMELRRFRPHIVQATHFYTNLYATIAGRLVGAVAIGCSRNDVFSELRDSKGWGRLLLRLPPTLLVNSHPAKENALSLNLKPENVHVITNVIDLDDFDERMANAAPALAETHQPVALAVGRLAPQKRLDRFLAALARARTSVPALKGVIAGDGPDRAALEQTAAALGLLPNGLAFLERRNDVPGLLKSAQLLVLSSDHEGFPNVILEAMAARLPVITTPAGESSLAVQDGITGYVVPFESVEQMAARMVQLAQSPSLRRQFGEAGRARVEQRYSFDNLADRLVAIYRRVALELNRPGLLQLLPTQAMREEWKTTPKT